LAAAGGVRMTVTFRDATVADAATLDRLFDTSFCDTFAHLYKPEDLDTFLKSFGIDERSTWGGSPAECPRITSG